MLESPEQYRLLDIILKGGWVMVPLILCSVLSLGLMVERLVWGPRKSRIIPPSFVAEIRGLIQSGRLEQAHGLCRATDAPLAHLVYAALRNAHRPREYIVEAMELVGRRESSGLQRFLGILGTIAAVSPLLGLLGTVSGMMHAFSEFRAEGIGNPTVLSAGIAEALITTAFGLTIAIPTLIFYRSFLHHTRQLVLEMEEISLSILEDIHSLQENELALPQKQRLV